VLAGVQSGAVGLDHLVAQRLAQALRSQLVGVQLACARVSSDFFIHQRLRQGWGVLLVVAKFAETHDVDDHVLAESHAVFECQLGCQHHGFWIITVDMQHRRFNHLDDVGTEHARAHVAWVRGGETDLVVHNDVHCAARGVTTGLGQAQGFLVHALAAESGVTVDQHGQHLATCWISAAVHASAYRTFYHGVDDFQVRGVKRQRQVHGAAFGGHIRAEALVVFHVTGWQVFGGGVIELSEQVGRQLAHGVDQHVQTTAVGHANHNFLNAFDTGLFNQLIHRSDEAFATFEREALLTHILGVEVTLQAFSSSQVLEDVFLLV